MNLTWAVQQVLQMSLGTLLVGSSGNLSPAIGPRKEAESKCYRPPKLGIESSTDSLALSMQNDIALFCSYKAPCAARWLINDTCTNFVQSPWCNDYSSEEPRRRSSDCSMQGVFSNVKACTIVISCRTCTLLVCSQDPGFLENVSFL